MQIFETVIFYDNIISYFKISSNFFSRKFPIDLRMLYMLVRNLLKIIDEILCVILTSRSIYIFDPTGNYVTFLLSDNRTYMY